MELLMVMRQQREPVPEISEHRAWHAIDTDVVAAELGTGSTGLTSSEASARGDRYGPNQLEETPPTSPWMFLLDQFRSPFMYLLAIAAAITIVLEEYIDSAVIAGVLVLNTLVGFTQERQAEVSIRSLMRLVSPHARVIRDGHEIDIESRDLVPGDLVLLESGARIPADIRLVSTIALLVDESSLTGESVVTRKQAAIIDEHRVLADRSNMIYAGTVVASGRGRGYVVATGTGTELGHIAADVRAEERRDTPLQRRLSDLARLIAIAAAVVSVVGFVIAMVRGFTLAETFPMIVAMAVSAVPEALPIVFTITLAVGVRRMASRNAVIRKLPPVETLGSTTVIGSDKTGTLTENRMAVREIWSGGRLHRIARPTTEDRNAPPANIQGRDPFVLTLLAGTLANEATLSRSADGSTSRGDPTEVALLYAAARFGIDGHEARAAYPVQFEIPFESERQFSGVACRRDDTDVLFIKGAPERVLGMCDRMLLDDGVAELHLPTLECAAADLAGRGLRVLAMAYRPDLDPDLSYEEMFEPQGLVFLGFQGSLDPPREGVREAIDECRNAGIKVVMITGDHIGTAQAIARALGIGGDKPQSRTGVDLEGMTDAELRERVLDIDVYARATPRHKLRVVQALQDRDQIVAVTGDGVNDAPALRAADIGVAMGIAGTDIAREASDMVLTDDNFVSVSAAVKEGRVAFENLRKVTFLLLSTGVGEVIAILVALALGWPFIFVAAQILWLNLATNGLQDVALAFEPAERDLMRRRPRPVREGILSRLLWERTFVAGIVMAAGTLFMFNWALHEYDSLTQAQTVALTTMVLFQTFQIGNARSSTRSVFRVHPFSNRFLFVAAIAALAVHIGALYFPPAQYVLRVEPVTLEAWFMMVVVASTIIVAVEIHKLLRRPIPQRVVAKLW